MFVFFRQIWTHELFADRATQSELVLADSILDSGDDLKCHKYLRMEREQFFELLGLIQSKISKQDTNWRRSISALLSALPSLMLFSITFPNASIITLRSFSSF